MSDTTVTQVAIDSDLRSAVDMTKGVDKQHYYYDFTVPAGNVATATVSLSVGIDDDDGDVINSTPTSGATFSVDNAAPTAAVTYSKDAGSTWASSISVKNSDTLIIKATFNEPMVVDPATKIALDHAVLSATDMTKDDSTHYTYTLDVGASETHLDTIAVSLSVGTDLAGNIITATPTSGVSFKIDNEAPTFTIQYYSNSGLSTSLGNNPYLKVGTYYIKITSDEPLAATPTVESNTGGVLNQVVDGATAAVSGNDYKYTRTIIHDDAGIGDSMESLTLNGTDLAGNAATLVPPTNYLAKSAYIDTVSPAVDAAAITSPNGGEHWAGDSVHNITWDPTKITDQNLPELSIALDYWDGTDTGTWRSISGDMANTGSYSWTLPSLFDRSDVTIWLQVTDKAENHTNAFSGGGIINFTIDSTPPMAPQVPDFVDDSGYRNIADKAAGIDAVVNFMPLPLGAAVGDTLELLLDGVSFPIPQTHVLTSEDLADPDNPYYLFTIPSAAWGDIGDGTKTITANTTDMAGNVGVGFAGITFILDTGAPTVDAGANRIMYANQTITQNGTVSGATGIAWSGNSAVGFGSTAAVSTISCATAGTYTLTLTGSDTAGNSASDTMTLTVYKNGDINNDGSINNDDFTLLMYNWGAPTNTMADYNSSGAVDNDDFTIMMYWWNA
ncbi:MAG: hypothetical protein NTY30_01825 [Candidatus Berkelbacteria bacterium]|nr:hypothetical protein [Candidatus Berkelbacteria bacterium]